MVSQGVGRISCTKDGRCFIYLPKKFVEDTAFPFPIGDNATKVMIRFKPGDKKLTIEKFRKK
ncbi:hypothetical protein [[Eubacterium] cellulosolvens]